MTEDLYQKYTDYVDSVIKSGDISNFKTHPDYMYMLEHCAESIGKDCFRELLNKTKIVLKDIVEFCNLNDSIGRDSYNKLYLTPSSLRYIYQAHLILSHFKRISQNNEISIVEIGGGYGGLFLAINYFNKYYDVRIKEYNIIDLPRITELQSLYLSKFITEIPIKFHSSDTYGSDIEKKTPLYLISNYCFSEIGSSHREKYIDVLFKKLDHGFITWNKIPIYDFGFKATVLPEFPYSSGVLGRNFYVYF
jgi:hypothetical protein